MARPLAYDLCCGLGGWTEGLLATGWRVIDGNLCQLSSKSSARKAASARIAKIPFTLSSWIGRCWLPATEEAA